MITLELGQLACGGLEAHFGADVPAGARKALAHYIYKLRIGRRPLAPPRFLANPVAPQVTFDLVVDPEVEAVLAQEALRQRIGLGRLAAHAVFVYLAELDLLGVVPRAAQQGSGRL